jgi:hypothetical protein
MTERRRAVRFEGLTVDVPVRSVDEARPFYEWLLGRPADLTPAPGTLEWILNAAPQIALRVVADDALAGSAHVGIGVADLRALRALLERDRSVPDIRTVPGVIALLELSDGDGNRVVYWEDLLDRA